MPGSTADMVSIRYMVDDVQAAVDFYARYFGFTVRSAALPAFADVARGNLRLLLSAPGSSAGRPMPDGRRPGPGGSQILLEDPSGNPVELFQPAGG